MRSASSAARPASPTAVKAATVGPYQVLGGAAGLEVVAVRT
ncbi:hypothetical protein [Pyxidicoccus trucidator]|nr:hypothetical protein [Pyxidicoccus trucidator]